MKVRDSVTIADSKLVLSNLPSLYFLKLLVGLREACKRLYGMMTVRLHIAFTHCMIQNVPTLIVSWFGSASNLRQLVIVLFPFARVMD